MHDERYKQAFIAYIEVLVLRSNQTTSAVLSAKNGRGNLLFIFEGSLNIRE
jgi:hypothetical protein